MTSHVKTRVHRGRMAIGVAASSLLFGGACAWRQLEPVVVTHAVTDWREGAHSGRRITTAHFEVFSTLTDEAFEAALPGFLESAHAGYREMLPLGDQQPARLTTYVFGTRIEWLAFARRHYPNRLHIYSRIQSGGFTEDTTAVLFYVSRSGTWATLAHEGWHQYVASRLPSGIPAWLNEGLACYHESVDFSGETPKRKPLHNTFRINHLRAAVQSGTTLSLGELVRTDAGRMIGHHHGGVAQVYYAQAWALITFLRDGADRRYASGFAALLDHLADGSFATRIGASRLAEPGGGDLSLAESVFPAYFGCRVEALASSYREHLLHVSGF